MGVASKVPVASGPSRGGERCRDKAPVKEGGPGRRLGETSYKVSGVRGQGAISRAQPRRRTVSRGAGGNILS
jgi:hypothetical protein